MTTYTNDGFIVSNTGHHFNASNMSTPARKAVKAAGLATPAYYLVLSYNSPSIDDDTPVIEAFSKRGRKSVIVTAADIFIAMCN